jgi:hypothetical protein
MRVADLVDARAVDRRRPDALEQRPLHRHFGIDIVLHQGARAAQDRHQPARQGVPATRQLVQPDAVAEPLDGRTGPFRRLAGKDVEELQRRGAEARLAAEQLGNRLALLEVGTDVAVHQRHRRPCPDRGEQHQQPAQLFGDGRQWPDLGGDRDAEQQRPVGIAGKRRRQPRRVVAGEQHHAADPPQPPDLRREVVGKQEQVAQPLLHVAAGGAGLRPRHPLHRALQQQTGAFQTLVVIGVVEQLDRRDVGAAKPVAEKAPDGPPGLGGEDVLDPRADRPDIVVDRAAGQPAPSFAEMERLALAELVAFGVVAGADDPDSEEATLGETRARFGDGALPVFDQRQHVPSMPGIAQDLVVVALEQAAAARGSGGAGGQARYPDAAEPAHVSRRSPAAGAAGQARR